MSRFDFRSTGAALARGLEDALFKQEAARRQQMLDGILLENTQRQRAREDEQARRQAVIDANAAADRAAALTPLDQDLDPATAATLQAGGYQTSGLSSLPSTSRVGDLASGVMGPATVNAPAPYTRRLLTPAKQRAQAEAAAKAAERERERQEKAREKAEERAYTERREAEKWQREVEENERKRAHDLRLEHIRQAGRASNGAEPKAPTQSQLSTDTFVQRAADANTVLNQVESAGTSIWNHFTPTWVQSSAGQAYDQARRQFTEAYLRRDSGAAISEAEYDNAARTYFPRPGDSADTVQRKHTARQQIIESMQRQGSGRATSSSPRIGERRMINGQLGEWDGRGWLAVGSGR